MLFLILTFNNLFIYKRVFIFKLHVASSQPRVTVDKGFPSYRHLLFVLYFMNYHTNIKKTKQTHKQKYENLVRYQ